MSTSTWLDQKNDLIESHLTDIVIYVVLAAEITYREAAVRDHEWILQRRIELEEEDRQKRLAAEKAERERLARLEQARVDRLLNDASLLRQSRDIGV